MSRESELSRSGVGNRHAYPALFWRTQTMVMQQTAPQTKKKDTGLPPYRVLDQRDFLARYGKTMADMMSRLMPPSVTGPEDTSCAPVSQVKLKRKPLGAQGFAA